MKVLITGAEGFIGKHLSAHLKDLNYEVIGVDFKDGDLREDGVADMIIGRYKPSVVIHLAAQVGIYFNECDCVHAINSNATMTLRVAKACTKHGARLIHTSTSEVYGDRGEEMLREDEPLIGKPTGIYAISKRWSEDAAKEYAGDGLVIIRPSMPYGPGEAVGQGRRAMDNMLWQAYWRMPIIVHKGSARSWCWIGDTVAGYELILREGASGIFNVGRDDAEVSMLEIAHMACDLARVPYGLITEVEPPLKKTVIKRLSTEKLRSLGWVPTVELSEGMPQVFEWVKNFDHKGHRI